MKALVILMLLPLALSAAERTFSVVTCGGVPRLAVDGVPCVGTAAMPSPKVAPGKSVKALTDFDRQGVRFYSDIWMMNDRRYLPRVWWRGEGDYDFGTFDALVKGLEEAGAEVTDLGLCTTPMVYFFTAEEDFDGSVMITASHNPPSDNGLKVSMRTALPVGYANGLNEVERLVAGSKLQVSGFKS